MDESIEFTPWIAWVDRDFLKGANDKGVYLLAHFPEGPPTGPASSLNANLVYIGETHGQTLLIRWRQFARSANTGERGHAGGITYHDTFGQIQENLYVACYSPPQMDNPRCRTFFIRYTEAYLVWRYVTEHEPDGLCNRH